MTQYLVMLQYQTGEGQEDVRRDEGQEDARQDEGQENARQAEGQEEVVHMEVGQNRRL